MKNLNFFVNEGAGVHLRRMNKKLSLNGAMGSGELFDVWVIGRRPICSIPFIPQTLFVCFIQLIPA